MQGVAVAGPLGAVNSHGQAHVLTQKHSHRRSPAHPPRCPRPRHAAAHTAVVSLLVVLRGEGGGQIRRGLAWWCGQGGALLAQLGPMSPEKVTRTATADQPRGLHQTRKPEPSSAETRTRKSGRGEQRERDREERGTDSANGRQGQTGTPEERRWHEWATSGSGASLPETASSHASLRAVHGGASPGKAAELQKADKSLNLLEPFHSKAGCDPACGGAHNRAPHPP